LRPVVTRLEDGHRWLRVADPGWEDPLDPTHAARRGGRWNPPDSYPTLYLNEDVDTARGQIVALLRGSPVTPEDLDTGFDLVVATLPRSQDVADAVGDTGLEALGLPVTYPRHGNGKPIRHDVCQPIGQAVKDTGLRGVHARSAANDDGRRRELAWFPARDSSTATLEERLSFGDWWYRSAETGDLG
jgi:hypothetical protein